MLAQLRFYITRDTPGQAVDYLIQPALSERIDLTSILCFLGQPKFICTTRRTNKALILGGVPFFGAVRQIPYLICVIQTASLKGSSHRRARNNEKWSCQTDSWYRLPLLQIGKRFRESRDWLSEFDGERTD